LVIGIIRDRLGDLEDRFLATVFLGSGLLFLAMSFVSAASAGALTSSFTPGTGVHPTSGAFTHSRSVMYHLMNIYAIRMAGVDVHGGPGHHLGSHRLDASGLGVCDLCGGSGAAAVWYTFVTITTVGYGDTYPVTHPGRLFDQGQGFFATLSFVAYHFKMGGMMMMVDAEGAPLLVFGARV
jgi:hypothetical protein